jgi:hypothetical protein
MRNFDLQVKSSFAFGKHEVVLLWIGAAMAASVVRSAVG